MYQELYIWVIDQSLSGQDGWILAKFFFGITKKDQGQCPAILTEQALVNKRFIIWLVGHNR